MSKTTITLPGLPGGAPLAGEQSANGEDFVDAIARSRSNPEDEKLVTVREEGTHRLIYGMFTALQHKYYSDDLSARLLAMRDASVMIFEENRYLRDQLGKPPIASFAGRLVVDTAMLLEDMAEMRANVLVKHASRPGRSGPTVDSFFIRAARAALGAALESRHRHVLRYRKTTEGSVSMTSAASWVIEQTNAKLRSAGLTIEVLLSNKEWDQTKPERRHNPAHWRRQKIG